MERAEEQVRVWGDAPASADVLMLAEALEEAQGTIETLLHERNEREHERDEAQGKLEAVRLVLQGWDKGAATRTRMLIVEAIGFKEGE